MRTVVSRLAAMAVFAGPVFAIEPAAATANVFIDSMNGFGAFLTAAFQVKSVPMVVVADRRQADFEIVGSSLGKDAHWAEDVLLSQGGTYQQATVRMINLKSGAVAFAYAYSAIYALHGAQSAAESCAKHLRGAIEKGTVNLRAAAVAAGHHAGEKTLVPPGEPDVQASIPPARQLLPVAVASDPPGARIEVEQTFSGFTPATIKLQPGEYHVTLTLAAHETWSGRIKVEAGSPTALAAALKPLSTVAAK
jgi:hypothetical protein